MPRKFQLEITEDCTLRCKYCFFTNDDLEKRKHNGRNMSDEIAYKAIDYYFNIYTNIFKTLNPVQQKKVLQIAPPNLNWWGGEPFLNFDLMRKTKKYFESKQWGKFGIMPSDLLFSTVTNLTVFNQEILDFILDSNMWLYISIDGNKESHDKNRVRKDNKGSFETVFQNIKKIIKSAPEYAKNRVIFQSVLANNTSEKEIKQFLKDNFKINSPERTVKKSLFIAQRVEKEYLSKFQYLNTSSSDYIENFKTILRKIDVFDKDQLKTFLKYDSDLNSMLENVLLIEKSLVFDNPKGIAKPNKMFSCPLGTDSIFVSLNGDIHCCNKVDYSFPIGDIHNGLDIEKLTNIYKNYHKKVNDKCSDCWAYIYCKMCPAMVIYSKNYYLPKNKECEEIKLQFEVQLKSYIALTEEFTNLYDSLSDIYYNKDVDLLTYSQPIDINNI